MPPDACCPPAGCPGASASSFCCSALLSRVSCGSLQAARGAQDESGEAAAGRQCTALACRPLQAPQPCGTSTRQWHKRKQLLGPSHRMGVSMGSARLPLHPMGSGSLAARGMEACPPPPPLAPASTSSSTPLLALSPSRRGATASAASGDGSPLLRSLKVSTGVRGRGSEPLPAAVRLPSDSLASRCSSGCSRGVGMRPAQSAPSAAMAAGREAWWRLLARWHARQEQECSRRAAHPPKTTRATPLPSTHGVDGAMAHLHRPRPAAAATAAARATPCCGCLPLSPAFCR